MQSRLILVDGSYYLYRSFYALPPLKTPEGDPTAAIYGIIATLKTLRKEFSKEDVIAVVLDSPTPTFRHKLYPDYKAHRLKMPEELQKQIPIIKSIIPAMGFPLILHPGVEADDIIGTLARQAEEAGISTVIATNDKDFAQLVRPSVCLFNATKKGLLDAEGVFEQFGVRAEQIIDYLSLVGDTSDNVPGVPLVGPKTAVKWLKQYHTLDNLLDNADTIPAKTGENLRANREHVLLAKQLITIKQDVNLTESLTTLLANSNKIDTASLTYWFEKLAFKQWLDELASEEVVYPKIVADYELILDQSKLIEWLFGIEQADYLVIDLETTSLDNLEAEIVGIGLGLAPQKIAYIPLQHDYTDAPKQLPLTVVLQKLKPYLESTKLKKIGHNLKYDQGVLANYGICLRGLYADTLLEAYLLDSSQRRNSLDALALEYLNHKNITFESIAGKGAKALSFNQIAIDKAAIYAAEDVAVCLALHHVLEPRLKASVGLGLRDTIEMPLISVLSRIERFGVHINAELLHQQSQVLQARLNKLEVDAYELAGQEFNLSSPQQLQVILYELHRLPVLAKTLKGQPSTSERVLQTLSRYHPLPKVVLEFRGLSKLKSTYTDSLPLQVHPKTGRVHTAYHQAVVTTGRLSSSNPNLQNIPIRTEAGRKIRCAFTAPSGYKLLSADYSQIELRIMAHFSEDNELLDALRAEKDVHAATAARLFGVDITKVSKEERRRAKVINFGLMYGMSAFGLATHLQTTTEAAKAIMEQYFNRYPGVKHYMETTRKSAREKGYVTTFFGRRLRLPAISSSNKHHQRAAERTAINAPLQGTAADIIKLAIINIDAALEKSGIDAKIVMQVHDELVFEIKQEFIETAIPLIKHGMQEAAKLKVPLCVSIGYGDNWDEAH